MQKPWRTETDLMDRLTKAQNNVANHGRDIMTISGFMDTREELEVHVLACEGTV